MRTRAFLVMASMLIVAAAGGAQQLDATVATVKLTKMQAILSSTLKQQIALYEKAWAAQGRTLTDDDRTAILNRMIDILLFQQAAERDNVKVTDAQLALYVEQARQLLSSQLGHDATEQELRAQVLAEGQTWEAWLESGRDQLLPQVYVSQVKAKELQVTATPTATDIRYYYESNLQQFAVGEMIEFRQIFVSLQGKDAAGQQEAKAKIEGLAQRIAKGESIEDLAASSSEDTASKDRGGYSGFLRVDTAQAKALGKDFVVAMLGLKEGQVSGVISSTVGYHIVKVMRIIPAKLYGLDEKLPPYYQQTVSEAILGTLAASSQQQVMNALIESTRLELRKAAQINIIESNLGFKMKK